jgi:hypothetical protein
MEWIKKNLAFVVGGVVALLLLGVAGYILFAQINENKTVDEEIAAQKAELDRIYALDPHPGTDQLDNIGAARKDQERIRKFIQDSAIYFAPIPPYERPDERKFKQLLHYSINRLHDEAKNAGVRLPPGYSLGLGAQRATINISQTNIDFWVSQIAEMEQICRILFRAKVNAIDSIRRVPARDELAAGGTEEFISGPIVTNAYSIRKPYEITFRGFSPEIAAAMEGFLQSSNFFLIKNLTVTHEPMPVEEVDPSAAPTPGAAPAPGAPPAGNYPAPPRPPASRADQLRNRYGVNPAGPGGGATPTPRMVMPQVARPAATNTGPVTVLSETPMKVVMFLEYVRLKPTTTSSK